MKEGRRGRLKEVKGRRERLKEVKGRRGKMNEGRKEEGGIGRSPALPGSTWIAIGAFGRG